MKKIKVVEKLKLYKICIYKKDNRNVQKGQKLMTI